MFEFFYFFYFIKNYKIFNGRAKREKNSIVFSFLEFTWILMGEIMKYFQKFN